MKKFTKETLRRVLRTFFQTFLGTVAGDIAIMASLDLNSENALKFILISVIAPAIAAGAAAVMNLETTETPDE